MKDKYRVYAKINLDAIYKKLEETAKKQLIKFHKELETGTYKRIKQNNINSNYWRKRGYKDGLISFSMNSDTIYNLTRALYKPYIGASYIYNDKEIKIWKVRKIEYHANNIEYGKVLKVENGNIKVKTPDGAVEIIEHEFYEIPKEGSYL